LREKKFSLNAKFLQKNEINTKSLFKLRKQKKKKIPVLILV